MLLRRDCVLRVVSVSDDLFSMLCWQVATMIDSLVSPTTNHMLYQVCVFVEDCMSTISFIVSTCVKCSWQLRKKVSFHEALCCGDNVASIDLGL